MHSYGVLDIKEIKGQKFIKLNNPLQVFSYKNTY